MYYAKFNNKRYNLLDSMTITKASNEVRYSDIRIDAPNITSQDLPVKYQEVGIYDEDDNLIFTGYVSDYSLPTIDKYTGEDKEVTISLYTPMKMATLRTCSINGTYLLVDLIPLVFDNLIREGYKIVELNVGKTQRLTVNFYFETIEYAMNRISNRSSVWWYIDEKKGIHVNNIEWLFSQSPVDILENKVDGLYELIPNVENIDYANQINLINARIYTTMFSNTNQDVGRDTKDLVYERNKYIKDGDVYNFNYPIDISPSRLKSMAEETDEGSATAIDLEFVFGNNYRNAGIKYSQSQGYYTFGNISFNDSDTETQIVLQRDDFFKNLITGIKFNYGSNGNVKYFRTQTALKYKVFKFLDNKEIIKTKGVVNKTGIIEKTIDVDGKWFNEQEAIDYCRSLIVKNGNQTTTVKLSFDVDKGYNVGDMLKINYPEFLVVGNFIITSIQKKEQKYNDIEVVYTCSNANLIENYIDLFRSDETEKEAENFNDVITAQFDNDTLKENVEVIVIEN